MMNTPVSQPATAQDEGYNSAMIVGDRRFIDQLDQIRKLKSFLFEEKAKFNPEQLQSIDLGDLNNIVFKENARAPSVKEWQLLDEKLTALVSYLNDDLRTRIRIRELGSFFGRMPILFLMLTVVSMMCYLLLDRAFSDQTSLIYNALYLTTIIAWTLSQGGLGACAYLATRVAVKNYEAAAPSTGATLVSTGVAAALIDPSEVTDRNVLQTRVILGPLFAFLVGLPLSVRSLEKLIKVFYPSGGTELSTSDFAIILVPFLLGFSTNLVLVILDRAIISIRTFFGLPSAK
jgi:hypothetical protein